jgi:fatty acid desaturase
MHLSPSEATLELALCLPWLAGSLWSAEATSFPLALGFSFVFFNAGVRQAHGAMHYAVGVSRRATEWVLFAISLLMLGSMHAVQVNHMRHHARPLTDEDIEGRSSRMSGLGAVLYGPVFALLQVVNGWRFGTPAQRRWSAAETGASAAIVCGALILPVTALRFHVAAMLIGHGLTAFFLIWLVHRGCHPQGQIARTLRGWAAPLFFQMFHHLEHHLFPAVPTSRLPELARRLDRAAPEMRELLVFGSPKHPCVDGALIPDPRRDKAFTLEAGFEPTGPGALLGRSG